MKFKMIKVVSRLGFSAADVAVRYSARKIMELSQRMTVFRRRQFDVDAETQIKRMRNTAVELQQHSIRAVQLMRRDLQTARQHNEELRQRHNELRALINAIVANPNDSELEDLGEFYSNGYSRPEMVERMRLRMQALHLERIQGQKDRANQEAQHQTLEDDFPLPEIEVAKPVVS